jgi:putative membrane protein
MMWDGGISVWGFALMTFNTVLVWALIILGIIALVRYIGRATQATGTPRTQTAAEQALAERYARGEIDEDEYRRRLETLRATR